MTAALPPASTRPTRIRLVPARSTAPPYDDEVSGSPEPISARRRIAGTTRPGDGIQGALALDFVLPSGVPAVPAPPPRLRLVGRDLAPVGLPRPGPDETAGRRPDAARWAATIVQAVVEVVAGDRPLTQLVRWTTAEVYEQLSWRRRPSPARLSESPGSRRSVVTSVHVYQPSDRVAEACAITRRDGRAAAIAFRLEADGDTWRCTAISLR